MGTKADRIIARIKPINAIINISRANAIIPETINKIPPAIPVLELNA